MSNLLWDLFLKWTLALGYHWPLSEFYNFLTINHIYPSDFLIFESLMEVNEVKKKKKYQTRLKENYYLVIKHILGEDRNDTLSRTISCLNRHSEAPRHQHCCCVCRSWCPWRIGSCCGKCGSYCKWMFINDLYYYKDLVLWILYKIDGSTTRNWDWHYTGKISHTWLDWEIQVQYSCCTSGYGWCKSKSTCSESLLPKYYSFSL